MILHRKEGTRCFVSLRPELESDFPGLIDAVLRVMPARTPRSADRSACQPPDRPPVSKTFASFVVPPALAGVGRLQARAHDGMCMRAKQ